MSLTRTAAVREEEAELIDLRGQADRSGAAAAQALAELSRRVALVRRPAATARRLTTDARVTAVRVVREGPERLAGHRSAWRAALAAIPVLALAAVLAYAAAGGKLVPAKIKFSAPERVRVPALRHRPH